MILPIYYAIDANQISAIIKEAFQKLWDGKKVHGETAIKSEHGKTEIYVQFVADYCE